MICLSEIKLLKGNMRYWYFSGNPEQNKVWNWTWYVFYGPWPCVSISDDLHKGNILYVGKTMRKRWMNRWTDTGWNLISIFFSSGGIKSKYMNQLLFARLPFSKSKPIKLLCCTCNVFIHQKHVCSMLPNQQLYR